MIRTHEQLLAPEIRCTIVGIGYNVALGIFGGTAPLVATYLVARTSDDFAPAYYLVGVALISFVATLGLPEPAAGREVDRSAPASA